jgi:hypothetical protein
MLKNTISYCEGNSFLERQIFRFKVNTGIKECEAIKENLKKSGEVGKEDFKLNLVIPSINSDEQDRRYLVIKGYNKDGSIKPLKKYKFDGKTIVEEKSTVDARIIVLDLYEKSVYLHNYEKDDKYYIGYILREEKAANVNINVIFTKEKVKVLIKNVNDFQEYDNLESFMDKFLM